MEQVMRSPGEDAEWDRVRVEEDPVLWELAVADKAQANRRLDDPQVRMAEELLADPPVGLKEMKQVVERQREEGRMFPDFTVEELAENFQQAAKMMAGAGASLPEEVEACLERRRCRPAYMATTRSWRCDHCLADLLLMKVLPDFSDLEGHPRPGAGLGVADGE